MNPGLIQALAEQYKEHTRQLRRYLHQHPELSCQEYATSAFVAEELEKLGIPCKRGIAKTGVVGLIEGKNPDSKVVALRGDMDALPIQEENNTDYRSLNPGVMHACGHDVHTSCLLGAARILSETKDQWTGSVKLIFQPSEEKLPGGASTMIQEGVLNSPTVQAIFGQHVFTPFKVGTVAFCPGKMMASTDEIYITVKGKGGHAAYPHLIKDPVSTAAQIIVALNQIVSRNISPVEPAVLSIGKVIAHGATNVIPDEVHMEGTVRAFDEQVRQALLDRLTTTAEGIARATGLEAVVDIRRGYPALVNDQALTQRAIDRARHYLGHEHVFIAEPRMGAEDFAFYSQEIPACFYRLGTGNPDKGITSFIHTPTFDIDEDALPVGTGLMAWNAIQELRQE
jgi:amidohydrolase